MHRLALPGQMAFLGYRLVALLLVALVVSAGIGPSSVQTPIGTQCPTAAVQKITVAVRDCCGRLVGLSNRAPRPGEKQFVQCHCAEKRAAQQKATTERAGSRLVFLGTAAVSIQIPDSPQQIEPLALILNEYASVPVTPATPPPLA